MDSLNKSHEGAHRVSGNKDGASPVGRMDPCKLGGGGLEDAVEGDCLWGLAHGHGNVGVLCIDHRGQEQGW